MGLNGSASDLRIVADPFLSGIMKCRAFNVAEAGEPLRDVVDRAGSDRIFATYKVPTHQAEQLQRATEAGFYVIDVNVTFDKPVNVRPVAWNGPAGTGVDIGFALEGDREGVGALAEGAFQRSRFQQDPAIPPGVSDEFNKQWALNFFAGRRGDAMIVARSRGGIVGFVQLLKRAEARWIVDLIAVHRDHRKQSVAAHMLAYAESNLADVGTLVVGTQVANVAAVRFYEKSGFRLTDSAYVLHFQNWSER